MSPVPPRFSWTLAGGDIPVLAGGGPRGRDCRVRVRPPARVLRGTRRGRGQAWGPNGGEARPGMAAAEGTARPSCQRRREDRAHPSHPFPSPSGRPRALEAPGRGVGGTYGLDRGRRPGAVSALWASTSCFPGSAADALRLAGEGSGTAAAGPGRGRGDGPGGSAPAPLGGLQSRAASSPAPRLRGLS